MVQKNLEMPQKFLYYAILKRICSAADRHLQRSANTKKIRAFLHGFLKTNTMKGT